MGDKEDDERHHLFLRHAMTAVAEQPAKKRNRTLRKTEQPAEMLVYAEGGGGEGSYPQTIEPP